VSENPQDRVENSRGPALGSRGELTLCVFIDALGWSLQDRWGFLEDRIDFRAPVETVLGYSSTCDPTILTGRLPREHDHFAFYRYQPGAGSFPSWLRVLAVLPRRLKESGRLRGRFSRLLQPTLGWNGYFQLYNVPFERLCDLEYTERRDLYEPGGIRGGQATLFDHLRATGTPYHRSDWRRPEKDNLRAAQSAIASGEPELVYLYLAEMDGLLHAHGTSAECVGRKLRSYEDSIRSLVELAERRYQSVRLLVFSDHGMTDVRATCDLRSRIEELDLEWGRDYGAVYDSTMARFWFATTRARRRVHEVLASEPSGRVLSDSELTQLGCDFEDRRHGETFFLLRPGTLMCPSDMGAKPLRGMHGYHPAHSDSWAFFGSNRVPRRRPRRLDDLLDVMLEALPGVRRRAA
jgi:hypothetical protein